jgi:hypothetical protein
MESSADGFDSVTKLHRGRARNRAARPGDPRTLLLSRERARTTDIDEPGSDRSSKFIFDLMEPEPPKVDRAVLDFVKGPVFDPADFVVRSEAFAGWRMVVAKVWSTTRPAGVDVLRT